MAVIAMLVIAASLWYTNRLVKSIAEQETNETGSFFFTQLIPGAYDMHILLYENETLVDLPAARYREAAE